MFLVSPRSNSTAPHVIGGSQQEPRVADPDLATCLAALPAAVKSQARAALQLVPDNMASEQWKQLGLFLAKEVSSCHDRLRHLEYVSETRQYQLSRALGHLQDLSQTMPAPSREPPPLSPIGGSGLSNDRYCVLVIEDNDFQREMITSLCKQIGFRSIHAFASGEEACAEVRGSLQPDVVLCDLDLGKGRADGFVLIAQLRKMLGNEPAVVIVSATTDPTIRERCLVLDIDAFVSKPLTAAQLSNVGVYVERRKRTSRLAEARAADLRQNILTVEAELARALSARGEAARGEAASGTAAGAVPWAPTVPSEATSNLAGLLLGGGPPASSVMRAAAGSAAPGGGTTPRDGATPRPKLRKGGGGSSELRKAVTFDEVSRGGGLSEDSLISDALETLLPLIQPTFAAKPSAASSKLELSSLSESMRKKPAYARANSAPARSVLRRGDSGNLRNMMVDARMSSAPSLLEDPTGRRSRRLPSRESSEARAASPCCASPPSSKQSSFSATSSISGLSSQQSSFRDDGAAAAVEQEAAEEGEERRVLCRMCETWVRHSLLGAHLNECAAALALRQSEEALNRELRGLGQQLQQAPRRFLAVALKSALAQCERGVVQIRKLHELSEAALAETASTEDAIVYHMGGLTTLVQQLGEMSTAGHFGPGDTLLPEADYFAAHLLALLNEKVSAVRQMVRASPEALDKPLPSSLVGVPSLRNFRLHKRIAKGGFGSVWVARKVSSGDIVALKILKRAEERTMTRVEELILKQHTSSFLVRGFYSFATSRHIVLALEFMPGGDLGTLLYNMGCLMEADVRFYLAEALLGLQYLHGEGVIHHDVKPNNMLLAASGHVKLTDFGLSAGADQGKLKRGTLPYIAPETLRGVAGSSSIDMWAMGVVFLELVSGGFPFEGETAEQRLASIEESTDERGVWQPSGGIDAYAHSMGMSLDAVQLVMALLHCDPAQRASCEDVQRHAFFAGLPWEQMEQLEPPFVPELDGPNDTSYFESTEGYGIVPADERLSDESSE